MRPTHLPALPALLAFLAGCGETQTRGSVQTARMHLHEGVKLLYNRDRSRVYKQNAPAATAAFSKSLEALLADEVDNPQLYEKPEIAADAAELRARAYQERATSYLIQGKVDLSVRDWQKVLETAEALKPKLTTALADPRFDPAKRRNLETVEKNLVDLEGKATGALGLHYLMTRDRATAEPYLRRAREILPPGDQTREKISTLLEQKD